MRGASVIGRGERPARPDRAIPAHPYRDTAAVYGVMAVLLVVVAGVTGGSLVRAAVVGAAFWIAATSWSWWRFRGRIRERDAVAAATAAPGPGTVLPPREAREGVETGVVDTAVNGEANGNGRRGQGS